MVWLLMGAGALVHTVWRPWLPCPRWQAEWVEGVRWPCRKLHNAVMMGHLPCTGVGGTVPDPADSLSADPHCDPCHRSEERLAGLLSRQEPLLYISTHLLLNMAEDQAVEQKMLRKVRRVGR